MGIQVTDKNFKKEVLESKEPVLVDFWAEWCAPCRMIAPAVAEIAKIYSGRLKVAKLNVDEAPGIAGQYGITGIPTLAVFKNGEMVERIVGAMPKAGIEQAVKPHLAVSEGKNDTFNRA